MDYKQEYEKLSAEFEQYKKESVKWGVNDFLDLELEDYTITENQAQEALEEMIHRHDCNDGITWDTLDYYCRQYGTKIKH